MHNVIRDQISIVSGLLRLPPGQSKTSLSSRSSGSKSGRPGSRVLRSPCLRVRSRFRFRLRFLGSLSLSLFISSLTRPGFTIGNLFWTPVNFIEGDKDRGILGFVHQLYTSIRGSQFKNPIGAVKWSGKFPSFASFHLLFQLLFKVLRSGFPFLFLRRQASVAL